MSVARTNEPGPSTRHENPPPWPDPDEGGADVDLPLAVGETLAERYVLEGILGTGGMGIVCRARHVDLEQPVAVKFLRKRFAEERTVVARFLEEARAAAALRSEHVVRVMDVGQTRTGIPYYVMEHLDGTDLETLLLREGPLRVADALTYVRQACAALHEAHALGIVHRDVKPENLFLSTRGEGKPVLKVVDFGIAKRLDPARAKVVTGPQDHLGSPCYMSPEQMWTPRSVDTRTDVWSLGVVLYQLLTGALPFDGETVTEVFARVASAEFTPMSVLRPDIDGYLDAIVRRCLEKSLGERYQSVDALANDLERYETAVLSGTNPSLRFSAPVLRMPSEAPLAAEVHEADLPLEGAPLGALAVLLLVVIVVVGAAGGGERLSRSLGAARGLVRSASSGRFFPPPVAADQEGAPRAPETRSYVVEPSGVVGHGTLTASGDLRAESPPSAGRAAAARGGGTGMPKERLTERDRRERAYDRYLARHGWRPLREVLEEMDR